MYEAQGQKLKECRTNHKLSLAKVAKKINVSANYLSMIERGLRKPSEVVMYALAQFYGIDSHEIFAMYDKIPTEQLNRIINSPSLVRILSKLDSDERFTDEEKLEISDALEKEISKILEKKRGR